MSTREPFDPEDDILDAELMGEEVIDEDDAMAMGSAGDASDSGRDDEEMIVDDEADIDDPDLAPSTSDRFPPRRGTGPPSDAPTGSPRRSGRGQPGGGGSQRRRGGGGGAREREPSSKGNGPPDRDGRRGATGVTGQEGGLRQGAEQNVFDRLLDKTYPGQFTFDPFEEMIDAQRPSGPTQPSNATTAPPSMASPAA
ncbi:hypothetical protein JCM10212_003434 [Sporobolomyces blumeae]